MKMSVFSIFTLIFMMFALVLNSVAEDSPQWHLPDGAIARLGKGAPRGIQYSPDGTRIAVATGSGVWIYDTRTGEELDLLTVEETPEELNVFRGWEADVRAIAYSPDGHILAIAGGYQVQLWDTVSGQRKTTLTGHTSSISNVAFSPDGRTLASSSIFSEIRLSDVNSGQHKNSLWGHTAYVASLSFSPDGATLASASRDKTIRLWDTVNEHHKATLKHTSSVNDIAFSPDGQVLASVSSDGTVQLWNAVNGQHKAIFEHKFWTKGVAFSPDGQTLAIGVSNGVELWDVNTLQLKKTLAQGHVLWVSEVTFSPDGQALAINDHAGVHLWHVQHDQHRTTLSHIERIYDIAFNPDGQTLATSNSGYEIWLWDTHTGTYIGKYETPLIENTRYPFENIAFSPDGRMLAGVNAKNTVLWDAVNGQHKATLKHTELVGVIAFSPDGQTLVSGGSDGTVQLWEVTTAQPKNRLIGHTNGVGVIAFSPDGQTLVSGGSDGTVQLWEVTTARLKATLTAEGATHVASLAFSPDGRTLASTYGGTTVWLWNARTGEHQITLKSANCLVSEADFTSDNNTLIITDAYGRVRLWDIARDTELKTFIGDKGGPKVEAIRRFNIALSRDGHTLASASSEGPVFLWDITPFTSQQTQPEPDTQQTKGDTPIQRYEREMVRLIYFRPTDRPSRQGINTELDTLIRWTQYFFSEQMQNYARKTFAFETDATGHARVHHVTGKFTDTYYHQDTYNKVVNEVMEQFDTSRDVFLIAVDVSSEFINNEGICGIGGGGWKSHDSELWRRDFGGTAVIPASGVCINPSITAHELGHVFGLEHDFRDDAYLMAYGTQERLSPCATEWLDAHRFFNNDPTEFNEAATMDIHASNTSTPGNLSLQFELTDADGLHQAQLILPTATNDPAQGTKLHSCKSLNGKSQTAAFLTTDLAAEAGSEVTLQVIDDRGGITKQTFLLTIEAPISNRAPVAVGTIPDQNLTLGGNATTLSISPYFSDPDGDVLRYKAESSKTKVVAVSLAGTQITLTPRGIGSASVAVTASDGKLLVTQRISVQVTDVQVNDATGNFDDAFNGTALQNPNWRWQNEPANWDVGQTRDGFLHIEAETNRNLWASDASHFLYQETDADTFDVETHFFSKWDTASGVNGLVVKSPADNNWVTIKFWSRDAGAKGQIQYQTRGRGLVADPAWRPEFGATELFLRLRKHGDTYTGWYKTREADPWIEIGVANFPLTPPLQLGIYAGVAAGTGTLTVDYDYFRSTVDTGLLASPVLHVAAMEIPTETTLLPNYPNPFNPETWIPYQLAKPADVTLRIYAVDGSLVRMLSLGHKEVGIYQNRSRAAYWDGKNEVGEPVASGVYFYTLTAGDFTATRKMLIRK